MTVIDAAAALAALFDEPGAERARAHFNGGIISSVNVTEVLTRLQDIGETHQDALTYFAGLSLRVVDFDYDQSISAAELRQTTRKAGLSLGDRACLALAIRENATAVTADRKWADLDVGCEIELIR